MAKELSLYISIHSGPPDTGRTLTSVITIFPVWLPESCTCSVTVTRSPDIRTTLEAVEAILALLISDPPSKRTSPTREEFVEDWTLICRCAVRSSASPRPLENDSRVTFDNALSRFSSSPPSKTRPVWTRPFCNSSGLTTFQFEVELAWSRLPSCNAGTYQPEPPTR